MILVVGMNLNFNPRNVKKKKRTSPFHSLREGRAGDKDLQFSLPA